MPTEIRMPFSEYSDLKKKIENQREIIKEATNSGKIVFVERYRSYGGDLSINIISEKVLKKEIQREYVEKYDKLDKKYNILLETCKAHKNEAKHYRKLHEQKPWYKRLF
jgi:hypothetical protein